MWRRKLLYLLAVWVLIEACEGSTDYNNCLVQVDSSLLGSQCGKIYYNSMIGQIKWLFGSIDDGDDELPDSSLHIVCTATEVNASFAYTAGSHDGFLAEVNIYDVAWTCEVKSFNTWGSQDDSIKIIIPYSQHLDEMCTCANVHLICWKNAMLTLHST